MHGYLLIARHLSSSSYVNVLAAVNAVSLEPRETGCAALGVFIVMLLARAQICCNSTGLLHILPVSLVCTICTAVAITCTVVGTTCMPVLTTCMPVGTTCMHVGTTCIPVGTTCRPAAPTYMPQGTTCGSEGTVVAGPSSHLWMRP